MSEAKHPPTPWACRGPDGKFLRPEDRWGQWEPELTATDDGRGDDWAQMTGVPVKSADGLVVALVVAASSEFDDQLVMGQVDAAADVIVRAVNAHADLLAELRDTAAWLGTRATVLRQIAERLAHKHGMECSRPLRDEAARLEGRAAVIRQTILKATGG